MSFSVEDSNNVETINAFNNDCENLNAVNIGSQNINCNNLQTGVLLQVYDPVAYSESSQALSLDDSLTVLNPGTNTNMALTLGAGQLNQMKTISIVSSSQNDNSTGTAKITLTDNYSHSGLNFPYEITLGPNVAGTSISYVTLLFSISAVNNWLIVSSNNATWTYTS